MDCVRKLKVLERALCGIFESNVCWWGRTRCHCVCRDARRYLYRTSRFRSYEYYGKMDGRCTFSSPHLGVRPLHRLVLLRRVSRSTAVVIRTVNPQNLERSKSWKILIVRKYFGREQSRLWRIIRVPIGLIFVCCYHPVCCLAPIWHAIIVIIIIIIIIIIDLQFCCSSNHCY